MNYSAHMSTILSLMAIKNLFLLNCADLYSALFSFSLSCMEKTNTETQYIHLLVHLLYQQTQMKQFQHLSGIFVVVLITGDFI